MKVLHISSGNLYGGVEVLLATMAREQSCCPELEPFFALCFEGRLSEELSALGASAANIGPLRSRYPWQVWKARRRLAALLREKAFDVVVCHMPWALAIFGPVVRQAKLPLVFWMHDVAEGKHWIERWAAACPPDLAICNSRFTAGSISKLFPRVLPRHEVINYPISRPLVNTTNEERAILRAELETPPEACIIVQVGRMEHYKGATLLVDALSHLAELPGWVSWIIGGVQRPHEAAYLSELRERAAGAGITDRVRFLGERRDVGRFLQAADIFCQPNLRPEPFGMVFVEALYAGLPVVSTALGGAMEIVDEATGRLVSPGSPDALADELRQLILDPRLRQKLGKAGPARAATISGPSVALSKLKEALQDILQSKSEQASSRYGLKVEGSCVH